MNDRKDLDVKDIEKYIDDLQNKKSTYKQTIIQQQCQNIIDI